CSTIQEKIGFSIAKPRGFTMWLVLRWVIFTTFLVDVVQLFPPIAVSYPLIWFHVLTGTKPDQGVKKAWDRATDPEPLRCYLTARRSIKACKSAAASSTVDCP